jgi:hypothetical protein
MKTEQPTYTYKMVSYDVWGNDKDGFEVNAAHYTGEECELALGLTDKQLITALKKQGIIKKTAKNHCIEIDGEEMYSLYFNYRGRPEFELRNTTFLNQ